MMHPNMTVKIDGFTATADLRSLSWKGVVADLWEVETQSGANGEYVSPYPRLFVVLEESSRGNLTLETRPVRLSNDPPTGPLPLSYVPANARTWSNCPQSSSLRHLDLHFDPAEFTGRLPEAVDGNLLLTPRLMFRNDRLMALARLLAEECTVPSRHDLYGESLVMAIFVELFEIGRKKPARPGRLPSRRLRQVTDFIEANCYRSIRLQDLANLAGLSPSYFSSVFKASTGIAPYQWQMRARIRRVQNELLAPSATLSSVAEAAGFADQAHLTRVFKKYVGTTPAAWLREHA